MCDPVRQHPSVVERSPRRGYRQLAGLFFVLSHAIPGRGVRRGVKRLTAAQVAIGPFEYDAMPGFHPRPPIHSSKESFLRGRLARVLLGELGGVGLGDPVRREGRADPGDQDGHRQLRSVENDGAFKCLRIWPTAPGARAQHSKPRRLRHGWRNAIAHARQTICRRDQPPVEPGPGRNQACIPPLDRIERQGRDGLRRRERPTNTLAGERLDITGRIPEQEQAILGKRVGLPCQSGRSLPERSSIAAIGASPASARICWAARPGVPSRRRTARSSAAATFRLPSSTRTTPT